MPTVETVNGPIEADQLGRTLILLIIIIVLLF